MKNILVILSMSFVVCLLISCKGGSGGGKNEVKEIAGDATITDSSSYAIHDDIVTFHRPDFDGTLFQYGSSNAGLLCGALGLTYISYDSDDRVSGGDVIYPTKKYGSYFFTQDYVLHESVEGLITTLKCGGLLKHDNYYGLVNSLRSGTQGSAFFRAIKSRFNLSEVSPRSQGFDLGPETKSIINYCEFLRPEISSIEAEKRLYASVIYYDREGYKEVIRFLDVFGAYSFYSSVGVVSKLACPQL